MRKRGEFFLTEKLELKNVEENIENRKSPVTQHGIVAGKFYQRVLKLMGKTEKNQYIYSLQGGKW